MRRGSSTTPTDRLLERARKGDRTALARLTSRYRPRLVRWARGRLPDAVRRTVDTDDLVQDTLLRTVQRFEQVRAREGAQFQAFVRTVLENRIREELRRHGRRPLPESLDSSGPVDGERSPLDLAVGRQALQRYERGLRVLGEHDRALVVSRVELGMTYPEIAEELGKPTANAARMAVQRALARLARAMGDDRHA